MGEFLNMRKQLISKNTLESIKNGVIFENRNRDCLVQGCGYLTEEHELISDIFEEVYYILNEKTFDIDDAINFFYRKSGVDTFIQRFKNDPASIVNNIPSFIKEVSDHFDSFSLSTMDYNKGVIKEGNESFPVDIVFGATRSGAYYNPSEKLIYIGIHVNAMEFLGEEGLDVDPKDPRFNSQEDKGAVVRAKNEVTPVRVMDSISHELTHWLEDALYKRKISKSIEKRNSEVDKKSGRDLLEIDTKFKIATSGEIESLVQQVKKHKKESNQDEWDDTDLIELMDSIPTLHNYLTKAKKKLRNNDYRSFVRRLFSRLYREDLLSSNMVDGFKTI